MAVANENNIINIGIQMYLLFNKKTIINTLILTQYLNGAYSYA